MIMLVDQWLRECYTLQGSCVNILNWFYVYMLLRVEAFSNPCGWVVSCQVGFVSCLPFSPSCSLLCFESSKIKHG